MQFPSYGDIRSSINTKDTNPLTGAGDSKEDQERLFSSFVLASGLLV
jgi:hypothetical protein